MHTFFFLCCHWNPPWCAVEVLRCAQLHHLDRHSLVQQPQQHGASFLLQKHYRVHWQSWTARPAQPAGTGRPCSKCLTCITVIDALIGTILAWCFFFSVLQGCETELERLFQGVLGYALLVILGFAIIKVKLVIISEANLNQFLTRCLHHAGNKLTIDPFCFWRACQPICFGSRYSCLECSACA